MERRVGRWKICNFQTLTGVLMATPTPTMKTNSYFGFIFISGLTALSLGAGLIRTFALVTAVGFLGLACNDYASTRTKIFRRMV
jgi:hypothetical protein